MQRWPPRCLPSRPRGVCGTAQLRWSSPTRAWRRRWRSWRATPRIGAAPPRPRRRGAVLPSSRRRRTCGRGGSWPRARRRGRPGRATPRTKPPTARSRHAPTRCCTRTSFAFARRIDSQSGGVAEEVSATLRAEAERRRSARLAAGGVPAGRRCHSPSGRRGIPSRTSSSPAPLATAAGESDDPFFDYVLGWELARQGSTEEASAASWKQPSARSSATPTGGPTHARSCWRPTAPGGAATCAACDGAESRRWIVRGSSDSPAWSPQALAELAGRARSDVGAWDDADAGLAEAIRLGEDTGQLTCVGTALSRQAEIAARRGEAERFEELTAAAARYPGTAAPVRCVRAQLALPARARHRPPRPRDRGPGADRALLDRATLRQRVRPDRGLHPRRTRRRSPEPPRRSRGARPPRQARGPTPAAERSSPTSTTSKRLFEESIADCSRGQATCSSVARTRLCYGERLRRANRRRDARRELGAALDTFEQLGAEPWADRTRRELRASGEHRRAQTPEARDDLTPQERQIAALAAEGRTNREIGALLFLSPRTIETHLGRVFRKLGIADRSALPTATLRGEC